MKNTKRLTLVIDLDVEGDLDQMEAQVKQYLTEPDYPFLEDYGVEAWGGYKGPVIHKVSVTRA